MFRCDVCDEQKCLIVADVSTATNLAIKAIKMRERYAEVSVH